MLLKMLTLKMFKLGHVNDGHGEGDVVLAMLIFYIPSEFKLSWPFRKLPYQLYSYCDLSLRISAWQSRKKKSIVPNNLKIFKLTPFAIHRGNFTGLV